MKPKDRLIILMLLVIVLLCVSTVQQRAYINNLEDAIEERDELINKLAKLEWYEANN